jgi:hypothetical protein
MGKDQTSREGLFAFTFSVFALGSTFFSCGSIITNDAYATFVITLLLAAAITFWIFPNARTRRAIQNYYEQHQVLIKEAEALNSQQSCPSQPTKPSNQVLHHDNQFHF